VFQRQQLILPVVVPAVPTTVGAATVPPNVGTAAYAVTEITAALDKLVYGKIKLLTEVDAARLTNKYAVDVVAAAVFMLLRHTSPF
jgi:hypothetical protein